MRRFWVGLLIVVGVLSLLVSSTSLWTRRQVINTEVFVATAQQVVADPAVQARITSQVVDSIMTNPEVQQAVNEFVATLPPRVQMFRPAIAEGARNILSSGVQTLLTSQLFTTVTDAVLTSAQTQLINGEDVRFTLGQAKALVPPEQQAGLAGQVLNLIPNDIGITVVTKADAPQLYTGLDLLKSAWLWVGLIALAALIGALVLSRNRRKTLRAIAVTTIVGCLLLALALRLARGPLLANVKPVNVAAADSIYQMISNSLLSWTLWLAAIMAVIVVVTLLWGRIGLLPAIGRGFQAVRKQASDYRVSRAAAKQAAAESGQELPREPWYRRMAISTRAFVDGLGLPDRLASLAALIAANLRMARWTGVVIGALILLFWPAPTLTVLIWVAALVALYIGLLELIMAVGGRAKTDAEPEPAIEAAADRPPELPVGTPPAPVPTDGERAGPEESPTVPVPAPAAPTAGERHNADLPAQSAEDAADRRRAGAKADLTTMGDRLDLLDRLSSAHSAGMLTDEEYEATKAQVLGV
jgi:hypothetical protein